jgi:hypothetical protein
MFPTPYYHDYVEYYGVLNGKPAHYWQATFLPGIDSRRVAGVYYSNLIGDTLSLFVCTWSTDITYYDIARRALLSVEPSN